MTKFVFLLCKYVTVSLSVAVCSFSELCIYMLLWLLLQVLKHRDACGHTVQVKCCEKPILRMCDSPCNILLRCGHKCTAICSDHCTQQCQELVPCAVRPACGHLVYVPCYKQNQSECYRLTCAGCSHAVISLLSIFREVSFLKLLCCRHFLYRML